MAKKAVLDPMKLGEALAEQLALYQEELVEQLDVCGEKHIKKLVKLTKNTAPERNGDFKRSITYKKHAADWKEPSTFEWGVRAPHHRITHLLVNGHPTTKGDRVPGDPFLQDALDVVLPEYEKEVEEILKNVK